MENYTTFEMRKCITLTVPYGAGLIENRREEKLLMLLNNTFLNYTICSMRYSILEIVKWIQFISAFTSFACS